MKRSHAAAVAATISVLTTSAGSQLAPESCVSVPAPAVLGVRSVEAGAHNALESIPKTDLYLGLRKMNGNMYARNGSGGADADVTPHIVIGPARSPALDVPPTPLPPGIRILPQLPRVPKTAPHR